MKTVFSKCKKIDTSSNAPNIIGLSFTDKKEEERIDKAVIQNVPTDFVLNYRQHTYFSKTLHGRG